MTPEAGNTRYKSYLLRCWRSEESAGSQLGDLWRFALQPVTAAGGDHTFASFAELIQFLQSEIAQPDVELPADGNPQRSNPVQIRRGR